MKRTVCLILVVLLLGIGTLIPQEKRHVFAFGGKDFLLDGKPLQIIGGEMHLSFAKIPSALKTLT